MRANLGTGQGGLRGLSEYGFIMQAKVKLVFKILCHHYAVIYSLHTRDTALFACKDGVRVSY